MITLTQEQFELIRHNYSRLSLYKKDNNDSEYYEGTCECPRCNGKGVVYTGRLNDKLIKARPDDGVCWQCLGTGVAKEKIKVITEDYALVLKQKEQKKQEKHLADLEKKKQELIDQRLASGYKKVDFKIADWFDFSKVDDFFYIVERETEKAVLIDFVENLDDGIHTSNWFPKSALIYP